MIDILEYAICQMGCSRFFLRMQRLYDRFFFLLRRVYVPYYVPYYGFWEANVYAVAVETI